jgi:hypothetical protein
MMSPCIQTIGPHHGDLMALEHQVEPASFDRRDRLRHARLAPHLVPQTHEAGIGRALLDFVGGGMMLARKIIG